MTATAPRPFAGSALFLSRGDWPDSVEIVRRGREGAQDTVDRLTLTVSAAAALHAETSSGCCATCRVPMPCPTIAALASGVDS